VRARACVCVCARARGDRGRKERNNASRHVTFYRRSSLSCLAIANSNGSIINLQVLLRKIL
jgi:hypothetical protein